MQSWVLGSQKEGQNSSSACTERVSHYHQPIVHGALVLRQRESHHTYNRVRSNDPLPLVKSLHILKHVQALKNNVYIIIT